MSINARVDEENIIHTHTHTCAHVHTMEYYAAIKKNDIMFCSATWMELEAIILSKLTQEKKTKYHIFSL